MTPDSLPIDAVLDEIAQTLSAHGRLVLHAPPGAGKTTRVPLHLLHKRICTGRIVMLEPRRVAARTAATRMATQLGEDVGATVGYRMRGATKVSSATRIEVVTEGVLTRLIQSDPELSGIGCVIFDEFHERSLNADLGLALCCEIRAALRPDLHLVVMSATLDTQAVAQLLNDAPVVTAQGQAYEVETIWRKTPWRDPGKYNQRIEPIVVETVLDALNASVGSVLVFLPGAGEIARVQSGLSERVASDTDLIPLYGALPFAQQMQALRPAKKGRRNVVLATSIAETSVTIPDIRIVIDAGLARRARFDAGSGMSRLVTERVTKAEAAQRRGRAGRVAAGICYRLWTKGEEGALAAFPPVEVEDDDLTGLALELALWGASDPSQMPFLTAPPPATFAAAKALLHAFGALDDGGGITAQGRKLAGYAMHPRLAQMMIMGERLGAQTTAAKIAAILNERDPVPRGDATLDRRLELLRATSDPKARRLWTDIKRMKPKPDTTQITPGALLSCAFPDRIALRRSGEAPRYLMSGGSGAVLSPSDPLASSQWLAIAELDGARRDATIRIAAPLDPGDITRLHSARIAQHEICEWDARQNKVIAERQSRLSALVLDVERLQNPDPAMMIDAMLDGIAKLGIDALPWTKPARFLQARVAWVRQRGSDLPDLSDEVLMEERADWLAPYLSGIQTKAALARIDMMAALEAHLGWEGAQTLDRLAPRKFTAPTGTGVAIDYSADKPKISIRLQEMLGLTQHPVVGPDQTPLLIELLSPAQRPIQTTADLPGFWATSYADVRKDMRGRYPKHPWPEDPSVAEATRRTKRQS
jgi:ATP-dependent helicase HrpB